MRLLLLFCLPVLAFCQPTRPPTASTPEAVPYLLRGWTSRPTNGLCAKWADGKLVAAAVDCEFSSPALHAPSHAAAGTDPLTLSISQTTGLQTALNALEATIAPGTSGQYFRWDKTWADLNKAAVGLSNVENTALSTYPIVKANSPLTTKGDLWVTDGTSMHRLGVGTDGHVLMADAVSTDGIKWADPSFMVYPGAGVPNSTGSAWGTSYAVGTGAGNLVQLNASSQLPAVSAALLTNFPTFNQNTTGTAAGLSATLAIASGGTGATTAAAAAEALLPAYSGNGSKTLTLNAGATALVWATPAGGGAGDLTGLEGSASLSSWGTIAAGGQTCKTVTITGVVGGDSVSPKIPSTIETGLIPFVKPITDGVSFCLYNPTASGIAPADGQTFGATIIRSTI